MKRKQIKVAITVTLSPESIAHVKQQQAARGIQSFSSTVDAIIRESKK